MSHLSDEEFRRLFAEYKAGSMQARDRILYSFHRFVCSIAQQYNELGNDMEDLIQEGMIGLDKALQRYDPQTAKFITYAPHWVRAMIRRFIRDRSSRTAYRISARKNDMYRRIARYAQRHVKLHGVEPTFVELVKAFSAQNASNAERLIRSYFLEWHMPVYLDAPVLSGDSGGHALRDMLVHGEGNAEDVLMHGGSLLQADIMWQKVFSAVQRRTTRDQRILILRFGLQDGVPQTLEVVGRTLCITRQRVQQLELKALNSLARTLGIKGPDAMDRVKAALEAMGEFLKPPSDKDVDWRVIPKKKRGPSSKGNDSKKLQALPVASAASSDAAE